MIGEFVAIGDLLFVELPYRVEAAAVDDGTAGCNILWTLGLLEVNSYVDPEFYCCGPKVLTSMMFYKVLTKSDC
jgi:hypothetical protein